MNQNRRKTMKGHGKSKSFAKIMSDKHKSGESLTPEEWKILKVVAAKTKANIDAALIELKNELRLMSTNRLPMSEYQYTGDKYSLDPTVIMAEMKAAKAAKKNKKRKSSK